MSIKFLFQARQALCIILMMVCAFFYSTSVSAQKSKTEDVVYLKNGSIIRGKIIDNKINEYIKIKTEGESEWVFTYQEIDRITSEEKKSTQGVFSKEKGLYFAPQLGLSIGTTSSSFNSNYQIDFTTNFAAGYHLNRYIGAGISLGLDPYDEVLLMPVNIDLRGSLLPGSVSPFYNVQTGYSIPLASSDNNWDNSKYKGGFTIHPALGILFSLNKNAAITLDAGFKIQNFSREWQSWNGEIKQNIERKRYVVRLGFIF